MQKGLTPETLDDIENKARLVGTGEFPSAKAVLALRRALDPTTVLALVAECRELRRLKAAMARIKASGNCGSDIMDHARILAWAKELEGT